MLPPNFICHFFNRDIFGLRKYEKREESHDKHPTGEEQEDAKLEMAQHWEESLCYNKSEEHVDTHSHTLSNRTSL